MAEFASQNPDPCEPLAGRFPEYDPEFLEAIDQAMAILPRERIQSARDWMNVITGRSDKTRPIRLTQTDDLNEVLSRLVSETNEYLSAEPRGADPRTRRKPTHAEKIEESEAEADVVEEVVEEPPASRPRQEWSEPVFTQPGKLAVPAKRRRWSLFRLFGAH